MIAFGEGRNNNHDILALRIGAATYLDSRGNRRAGGNPDRNTLDPRAEASDPNCLLIRNGDHFVLDLSIENRWDETGADTLNLVRPRLTARQDWA